MIRDLLPSPAPSPLLVTTKLAAALLIAVCAGGPAFAEAPSGDRVATWNGGHLERADYLDWLTAKGLDDDPESIRELVFVRSLASITDARLDDDPGEARRIELEVEARRHRLLLPLLRNHVVGQSAPIDEDEIEAQRRADPDAFVRPRKLRLRNLYKALGDEDRAPEVRAAMAEIRQRLVDGADFGELARAESESQTRFREGRLGLVELEDLPPRLAKVIGELEAGEISPPIEYGGGLTLFWLEEIRPAKVPTPEEVREILRNRFERQQDEKRWETLQDSLVADARIDLATPKLTLGNHRLGRDDIRELVEMRSGRDLGTLGRPALDELLRGWALGVGGSRRAVELGLDRDPEVAAQLRWLRTETLARRELVRRVEARIEAPDEAALRRWFESKPRRYREPAAYDLAVIQVADPDRLAAAKQLADELARGEIDFEEAARRGSDHPSASSGGRLGWRPSAQLANWGPTAARAIRALEPGTTSELLHTESGLWIFRLLDHREARPSTFDEVRARVEEELRAEQVRELEQTLRAEHLESIDVIIPPAPGTSAIERPAPEPVILRWTTASEHECFGYHVYRAEQEDGPFERLTDEVIEGGGTTDLPRSYRFEDAAVEVGETFYYYVETVSTDGTAKRLTPVRTITVEARDESSSPDPTPAGSAPTGRSEGSSQLR